MSRPVSGRAAKLPGRQAFAVRSAGFASDVAGTAAAFMEQVAESRNWARF